MLLWFWPHDEHLFIVNSKVLMLLCKMLFYLHTFPTNVTFSGDSLFSRPCPGVSSCGPQFVLWVFDTFPLLINVTCLWNCMAFSLLSPSESDRWERRKNYLKQTRDALERGIPVSCAVLKERAFTGLTSINRPTNTGQWCEQTLQRAEGQKQMSWWMKSGKLNQGRIMLCCFLRWKVKFKLFDRKF